MIAWIDFAYRHAALAVTTLALAFLFGYALQAGGFSKSATLVAVLAALFATPTVWITLERDVAQFTILGAVAAAAIGAIFRQHYAILEGALVGAVIGDAIRDVRTEFMTKVTLYGPPSWWAAQRSVPSFSITPVWLTFFLTIVLIVPAALIAAQRRPLPAGGALSWTWQDLRHVAESGPSWWWASLEGIPRVWPVVAILGVSLFAVGQIHRAGRNDMNRDRGLRRLAITHSAAVALLSWTVLWPMWRAYGFAAEAAGGYPYPFEESARVTLSAVRDCQLPALLWLLSLVLTGKYLARYVSRYAWIAAAAGVAALSVALTIFQALYVSGFAAPV